MGNEATMPKLQGAGMPPRQDPVDPFTMECHYDFFNRAHQAAQWPPGCPVPGTMVYHQCLGHEIERSILERAVMGVNGALSQLPSSRRPPPLVLGQRAPQETVEAYADYVSETMHNHYSPGKPYQKRQPNPAHSAITGSDLPYPSTAGSNPPYPDTTGSSTAYPPTQATSDAKSLPTGPVTSDYLPPPAGNQVNSLPPDYPQTAGNQCYPQTAGNQEYPPPYTARINTPVSIRSRPSSTSTNRAILACCILFGVFSGCFCIVMTIAIPTMIVGFGSYH